MKKTLIALALALTATSAQAVQPAGYAVNQRNYNAGYKAGYDRGKTHAYDNAMKVVAGVGLVVIGTAIIYKLGQESRWTANQNGIGYRF